MAGLIVAAAIPAAARTYHPQVSTPPAVRDAQPRDGTPAVKGTASIRGRVTSLDTGRPLRRARIIVSSPALSSTRTVSTSAEGRYEILELPAGRYTVRVERGGYLPLAYGQRRPGELGKPIDLEAQESATGIDFALPRTGVISGRVVDELGEPISQIDMFTMRVLYYQGERRLVPTGIANHSTTDENGMYRLLGLPPGEFVVMAHSRVTWPDETNPDLTLSYLPSYYPGTAMAAAAQRVKVGMGQEVGAIDFALVPGRTSRVSGTVVTAQGAPVVGETVTLTMELTGPKGGIITPSTNDTHTGADGTFTLSNVQTGEYFVSVRVRALGDQPPQVAREILKVAGADIDGLTIVTGAGGTMHGQVVTDDGSPLPPTVDQFFVRPKLLTPGQRLMATWTSGNGRVDRTGAFALNHVFGPLRLTVENLSGHWTLKHVFLDRRDLADEPIDVAHGATITGLRVVLTNKPTLVRGTLRDEKLRPAEGTVLVFPEDPGHWRGESRRLRVARPDQRGTYSFSGLPAGSYLIAAVDYVEDSQWNDPEFLDATKTRAARFTIADGEEKQIDVMVQK